MGRNPAGFCVSQIRTVVCIIHHCYAIDEHVAYITVPPFGQGGRMEEQHIQFVDANCCVTYGSPKLQLQPRYLLKRICEQYV